MKLRSLLPVLATAGFALTAFAQTPSGEPTMNPNESAEKKADPNSLGLLQKDRPKGAKTEITAQEESTFDNEKNLATFKGQVVVKDPQFTLFCDLLSVYLNQDRKGLDRAEAEGNVVIVQENVNERGEIQKSTGRSGMAVFEPASGNVTMTISPSIQQGIQNHIATQPTTIMILNREGTLETIGPSRTTIVDATAQ